MAGTMPCQAPTSRANQVRDFLGRLAWWPGVRTVVAGVAVALTVTVGCGRSDVSADEAAVASIVESLQNTTGIDLADAECVVRVVVDTFGLTRFETAITGDGFAGLSDDERAELTAAARAATHECDVEVADVLAANPTGHGDR